MGITFPESVYAILSIGLLNFKKHVFLYYRAYMKSNFTTCCLRVHFILQTGGLIAAMGLVSITCRQKSESSPKLLRSN